MNYDIYHDSQDISFRRPFGAVTCGSLINLKIVLGSLAEQVTLRFWRQNEGEQCIRMELINCCDGKFTYQAKYKVPDSPGLIWYYFIIQQQERNIYYGNNQEQWGGVGAVYSEVPPSYQITVYKAQAKTPRWFKQAVMYQIFVDRFYRDTDENTLQFSPGSVIHNSWDDPPFYIREETGKIFAYDFFGGNLAGIIKKLPYLSDLGIRIIYLNPIFQAVSNHKYDTADYHNIDPSYGNNETLRELCSRAKIYNIDIVLDGVFSHTGSDSLYFNKEGRFNSIGAYQSPSSPYYSWYRFKTYPVEYDCWWGIDTLPNVNELDPSYLNFIIYGDRSVLKTWMKQGIKGWRLDVADELPDTFLKFFYQETKKMDPEAVIIGEIWEDASHKESYGKFREYLFGEELDSTMNYPLRQALITFVLGNCDAETLNRMILSLYENYPKEYFFSAMNILGTHDVPRILTVLSGASFDNLSIGEQAKYRLPKELRNKAEQRLKLLSVLQMTLPGVPCIYYGDEAGVEGLSDPFNRGTYPWGKEAGELLEWYKKIIKLRNKYAIFQTGDWNPVYANGEIYGFVRYSEKGLDAFQDLINVNSAVVLVNRSTDRSAEVSLDLKDWQVKKIYDAFTGQETWLTENSLVVDMPPLSVKIFVKYFYEQEELCRGSGVLMHLTSLPSPFGIGDLGTEAYRFIDFLVKAGQMYWQVLPLNPVGLDGSPYQSCSAFAANELMLSPEVLLKQGLLNDDDLRSMPKFSQNRVEFSKVRELKEKLYIQAFKRFTADIPTEYFNFIAKNQDWLDDYALFMACKKYFNNKPWNLWEEGIKNRYPEVLTEYKQKLQEDITYIKFLQYMFFIQWNCLRSYANSRGIKIIGDMPLFVAHDSSDVWSHRELFLLDQEGYAQKVAGVPPDYFSAHGQLWGNPVYDWGNMEEDGYSWWIERFKQLYSLVDVIRIDHFRGFAACWEIMSGAKTAEDGEWVRGPGREFFVSIRPELDMMPVIAEDLGFITPDVVELRKSCSFLGMTVLQFAFTVDQQGRGKLQEVPPDTVVYTGTHDNDTTVGWYELQCLTTPAAAASVCDALALPNKFLPWAVCWALIEVALFSSAQIAIIPMQDLLVLDSKARMNCPGTVAGNWEWRMFSEGLTDDLANKLADLVTKARRKI